MITAVFNGRQHLTDCIQSVLNQDYPNIEHIIIDGGSTDGTLDLLRQSGDKVALWESQKDRGVYDAWNKGLSYARGEWICFLGADDQFLPGGIRGYINLAAQQPAANYLCSKVRWDHPSGVTRVLGKPCTWLEFSRGMCALHVGSMHRRELFDEFGTYDLSYRIVADYEFLLRPRSRLQIAFLPEVTVAMRAGGMSDTIDAIYEANRARRSRTDIPGPRLWLDLAIAVTKFRLRPITMHLRAVAQRRQKRSQ